MREPTRVAATIRGVVSSFVRRWLALETDYKSIAVACGLVGLVVGFGVQVPW